MKKFINLLSFGSAFITSILIICTFLTTYQFYYVGQVFNSYFLGGLEVLHEQFVDQCITDDDYLKKMFDYVRHFDEEQDGEALKASIDKLLNK